MQERNWKEYNQKLIRRGTIYVDKSSLRNWEKELRRMNRRKEGHSYEYPDSFIKFVGILRMQLMFPYRKLNGFLLSFSEFFKVPDYTTIFRRMNKMKLDLRKDSARRGRDSSRYILLLMSNPRGSLSSQ